MTDLTVYKLLDVGFIDWETAISLISRKQRTPAALPLDAAIPVSMSHTQRIAIPRVGRRRRWKGRLRKGKEVGEGKERRAKEKRREGYQS